ncbi:MAG: PAS domain S-box protein, partial [Chloroflexota bacterium]
MNPSAKILIVDDDPGILLATRRVLELGGYQQLLTAKNAAQALEQIHTQRPDLVLLDWNLPDRSGIEVCQQAKQAVELQGIFIIMYSAVETDSDKQAQALEAGADGYIAKPISNRELLARIEAMLRIQHAEAALQQAQSDTKKLLDASERSRLALLSILEDHKRTQAALQANQELLALFIKHSPIYAFIKEVTPTESRVLYASENYQMMTGVPRSQMIGKTMPELFPPEFAAKMTADDWAVASTGSVLTLDEDLNDRQYTTIKFPIPQGEQHLLAGYTIDITERKRAELELQEVLLNLESAEQQAGLGSWYFDVQASRGWWSAQMYTLFYLDPEQGIPANEEYIEMIHPEDRDTLRKTLEQMAQGELPERREFRTNPERGALRILLPEYRIEKDPTGNVLRFFGTVLDITQRKQAEQKLRASEERYRGLVENMSDIVMEINAQGQLCYVSPNYPMLSGYTLEDELGSSALAHVHPEDLSQLMQKLQNVLSSESQSMIYRVQNKSGEWRWVESSGKPYHTTNDGLHVISIVRDITERKQAEIEIKQSNDDLNLINVINAAVVQGKDLREIMTLLAQELKHIFASEGSSIYILDPGGQSLTMQQFSMTPKITRQIEKLIGSTIPLIQIPIRAGGYFQKVLSQTHGSIISDPQEIQNWIAEFVETKFLPPLARKALRKLIPQIYKILHIRSAITVPLSADGKTIGLWDVSSQNQFTDTELRRIESISGQLTAAIQRQQTNEKVQRSEEFLQSVQNALSAHIAILDEEGTIVQVNSAWRKFAEQNGLNHPNYGIGLNYLKVCDSATGPDAEEASTTTKAIRDIIAGHIREALIEYPCHSPKEQRWFNLRITKFEAGEHIWVVLAHENITARKLVEEALKESSEQFRTLFEASPEAIMIIDPQAGWSILDCNATGCAMNGYARSELIGRSVDIFNITPGNPTERSEYFERVRQAGVLRFETTHRRKDGTVFPVDVSTSLILLNGHEVVLGIDRDITERKRAENELRESEALYRQAIEVAGAVPYLESYYNNGSSIKYEFIGEGIRQITGYGPEEFSAKIWDTL